MPNRIKEIYLINLEITLTEKHYIEIYLAIPEKVKQQIINKLVNGIYKLIKLDKFKKTEIKE